MLACMYVRTYVCMCACMYVCMYVYMYLSMKVCIYVPRERMHACMNLATNCRLSVIPKILIAKGIVIEKIFVYKLAGLTCKHSGAICVQYSNNKLLYHVICKPNFIKYGGGKRGGGAMSDTNFNIHGICTPMMAHLGTVNSENDCGSLIFAFFSV